MIEAHKEIIDKKVIDRLIEEHKDEGDEVITPSHGKKLYSLIGEVGIEYDIVKPYVSLVTQFPHRRKLRKIYNYKRTSPEKHMSLHDMLHNGFKPMRFVSLEKHFSYRGLHYVDCLCFLKEDDTKSINGYIDLGIKGQVSPETFDTFKDFYND
jgi:hypothetical protein